jgi:hypothetical protein
MSIDPQRIGGMPADQHALRLEWLTFPQFRDRYVYNQGRAWLFEGLVRAARELRICGCSAIYVGGSFVDDEEYPSDYDAVFETTGVTGNLDPALFDQSRKQEAIERYRGDWLMGRLGGGHAEEWIRFLAVDRQGASRTIIAIKLRLDEIDSL